MRRGAKPAKAKVEAKPPIPRKSAKSSRASDLGKRLAEAQEQRAATAEILRALSGSPTDLQPVFDTIVRSAARLCHAATAAVFRVEGGMLHHPANYGGAPEALAAARVRYPRPVGTDTVPGQAILGRVPIQIPDVADPSASVVAREAGHVLGFRSCVAVPMLSAGEAVGAIVVTRRPPGLFSDAEVELLKTFADQAVIAIENTRLFNQTKEALERQTATSEILRVISSSPTDTRPVFDTIAANAAQLCAARDAQVLRVEGDVLRLVSAYGSPSMPPVRSISRGHAVGRAVIDRQTIHVRDMAQAVAEFPETTAPQHGVQSVLAVPLLRKDVAVGVIRISRTQIQPFTDAQIALLQTFADQAVIAIENARLFAELEARNRELTESLDRQTATAEILRVISSSPADLQPVFDAIVRNAVRLCGAAFGELHQLEGDRITLEAQHGVAPDELAIVQRDVFPLTLSRESATGRALLERAVTHIRDIREDPGFSTLRRQGMQGHRTTIAVPMMREGSPVGALALWRREVQPFSEAEIGLVQTFADQAVIAIENARLLTALQARTADLTRSVDQLTALGEVGQAVSSSLDLETVLTTIVSRAVQLSGLDGGVIFEYDEAAEEFAQRAATEPAGGLAEARRAARVGKGEGVVGRTAVTLAPAQVPDITRAGAYESRLRETLIEAGVRAVLAVPMLREGHLIGCLAVTRNAPGDFPLAIMELLRTFATQSALAIQNARLFREIADKSRQLEAASQHKSEFLANMSHELRTPLNAIIGFSEVLTDRMFGELNEKQDEYLRDIHASGQHLLSLINDILDLSKIEAGRMELDAADFDLPSAIENALILVRERASRKGIVLGRTLDERQGTIRGDERKVKQILLNLLSNALKFTPEGGRVDVRAAVNGDMVEVSVADTGVGIAPEDQEAVFEAFRQVGTAEKKVEGTGLGLALCRKFIELHGGKIWVQSQVGRGSSFTFTLPLRR